MKMRRTYKIISKDRHDLDKSEYMIHTQLFDVCMGLTPSIDIFMQINDNNVIFSVIRILISIWQTLVLQVTNKKLTETITIQH